MPDQADIAKRGRRLAVFLAAVGVFWILIIQIGNQYDWSQRTRALFDLIVLAGFGYGLWQGYGLWRDRRRDED